MNKKKYIVVAVIILILIGSVFLVVKKNQKKLGVTQTANSAIDLQAIRNANGFTIIGGTTPSSLEVTGTQAVLITGDSSQRVSYFPTSADHYIVASTATGTQNQIPVKGASDLAVWTDVNKQYTSYAAGTVYTMTNTAAQIVFGTTSPAITLDTAGTYLIYARVRLDAVGATYAANQLATIKLRRTNNTAADLTGATAGFNMPIITTITQTLGDILIPITVYTTANTTDIIQVWGSVAATPAAGSITVNEAEIIAIRLY